jgi:hypothetical protein
LYLVLVSSSNLDKARKVAQLALGGALRSTRQTRPLSSLEMHTPESP